MSFDSWLAFTALWFVAVATPAANAAFCMAVGSRFGGRAGLFAALGIGFAVSVYVGLVGLGLGALLATSAALFNALKWAGVAYLAVLGFRYWLADPGRDASAPPFAIRPSRLFAQGMMISLTNPKSAVLYAVFLPQFIDPQAPAAAQLLILGATSVAMTIGVYGTYALAAGRLRRWTASRRAALARNRLFGTIFIGSAAALALAERR